nr:hypothetical protein OG999_32255 [Streptomyces sp. NBC_00886]
MRRTEAAMQVGGFVREHRTDGARRLRQAGNWLGGRDRERGGTRWNCSPRTGWRPKNRYARWYATNNTPTALVKAITQSVSDPAPLPRWRDSTLPGLREAAQLTPVTPPAPSVPTPLDIQRARTRRPPALGTRSVPRWSTATLPPAPAAPHTATRR